MSLHCISIVAFLGLFVLGTYSSPILQKRYDYFAIGDMVEFDDLPGGIRVLDGYKALNWDNLVTSFATDNTFTIPSGKTYARTPLTNPANPVTAVVAVDHHAQEYVNSYADYPIYNDEKHMQINSFYFACTAHVGSGYVINVKNIACSLTIDATGCSMGQNGAVTLGPYTFKPAKQYSGNMTQVTGLDNLTGFCTKYTFTATPANGKTGTLLNLDNLEVARSGY